MKKIINSPHYHIWSDALHLRELARQTTDRWDRGTYVRSAVVMAWTAFEATIAEALSVERLGGRFRDKLDDAIASARLAPLDWGSGIWQSVASINSQRVDYVHRASGADLFPDPSVADAALDTIRNAIADIYARIGAEPPSWIADDSDRGWMGRGVASDFAYGTAVHAGADRNAPDTLRLVYVDRRGEHVHAYHPAEADPHALASELLNRLRDPVSVIRVYRGHIVELEWTLSMRGAP